MNAMLILGGVPAASVSQTLIQIIGMLVGPLFFLALILGVMFIKLRMARMHHDLIMKAMEKGVPLPEAFYRRGLFDPATRWIRSVALAAALIPGGIFLFVVGFLRTDGQVQGLGGLFFFIGVALMVWGILIRKHVPTSESERKQVPPNP